MCPDGLIAVGNGCESVAVVPSQDMSFGVEGRVTISNTGIILPAVSLTAVAPDGTLVQAFESGTDAGLAYVGDDGTMLRRELLTLAGDGRVRSVFSRGDTAGFWLCGGAESGYLLTRDWAGEPLAAPVPGGVINSAMQRPRICNGATELDDGTVLMAGQGQEGSEFDIIFAGFTASGSPSPQFGTAGVVQYRRAGEQFGGAVQRGSGGELVFAGSTNRDGDLDGAILVLNERGEAQSGFADDGWFEIDFSGEDDTIGLALPADDGSLTVIGRSTEGGQRRGFVTRVSAQGAIDRTFADDGFFRLDSDAIFDTAVLLPDSTLVVGGSIVVNGVQDALLFRLNRSGALDPSFGLRQLDLGFDEEVDSLTLDRDGRLVVSGTSNDVLRDEASTFIVRYVGFGE